MGKPAVIYGCTSQTVHNWHDHANIKQLQENSASEGKADHVRPRLGAFESQRPDMLAPDEQRHENHAHDDQGWEEKFEQNDRSRGNKFNNRHEKTSLSALPV